MILGDLHRSNRISSNFSEEIKFISHKYQKANYLKRFINSVIRQFQDKWNQSNIDDFDDYIIPSNLFDIPKSFWNCFEVAIKWKTRQGKTLFPLRDKSIHPFCVICQGTCECGETYIGETIRSISVRWEEHNNPTKSQPAKHVKNNFYHVFNWVILCKAPQNY